MDEKIQFSVFCIELSAIPIRLSQTMVLSSQTKINVLCIIFSYSLGQNYYIKMKIENFCPFFQPAQAVQSFTT